MNSDMLVYHEGSGFKTQVWYVVHHGETWALHPDGFLLRVFFLDFLFWGIGPCGPVPSPPLEWNSFPPLVTAVLITFEGAESPGSYSMGVIGALVYFLPSETVGARGGGGL